VCTQRARGVGIAPSPLLSCLALSQPTHIHSHRAPQHVSCYILPPWFSENYNCLLSKRDTLRFFTICHASETPVCVDNIHPRTEYALRLKHRSRYTVHTASRQQLVQAEAQSQSQSQSNSAGVDPELIASRTRRHLADLERANPVEDAHAFDDLSVVPAATSNIASGSASTSRAAKSRGTARQTISDKKDWGRGPGVGPGAGPPPGKTNAKRKQSSMAIRDALLYRQNLTTLIERSVRFSYIVYHMCTERRLDLCSSQGIATLPGPTYLTAVAPPPPAHLPARAFCDVCGYWGRYRCMRCARPYCCIKCKGTHEETRCEKRIL
jgi:zinc finger HIT domain-containing protein 1